MAAAAAFFELAGGVCNLKCKEKELWVVRRVEYVLCVFPEFFLEWVL